MGRLGKAIKRLLLFLWCLIPLPKEVKRPIRRTITHIFFSRKFSVGVLAVIIDNEGRVLLFHHTYLEDKPWGLPGGGVKRENLEEALKREIKEEIGVSEDEDFLVEVHNLIGVARDGRWGLNVIFACSLVGSTFKGSEEVDDFGWFSLDELPDVALSHRMILDALTRETNAGMHLDTSHQGYMELLNKKLGSCQSAKNETPGVGNTHLRQSASLRACRTAVAELER